MVFCRAIPSQTAKIIVETVYQSVNNGFVEVEFYAKSGNIRMQEDKITTDTDADTALHMNTIFL